MAENQVGAVSTQTIRFPNGREARLVKASPSIGIADLVAALSVGQPRSLMLVVGGADELDEQIKPRLKQVFSRAIARVAAQNGALILDGGTQSGVMELLGAAISASGAPTPLIGVAPAGCVTYPGHDERTSGNQAPLDANHTHFLLADGEMWGSETHLLFEAAETLGRGNPVLTILVNGGEIAKAEVLESVRRGWPVIAIRGTGRLADQVAALAGQNPATTEDADLTQIAAEGRIITIDLDDNLSEIERVIAGRPRLDQTLHLAWKLFLEYDGAALGSQKRFRRLQMLILTLGVLATLLAIEHQRGFVSRDIAAMSLQVVMILMPIAISILIAWASRFRPGNKWVLLRAAAEAIKRETFRYRARAGVYSDAQCRQVPREAKLAQEIETISDRLQRTEVNSSVIPPASSDTEGVLGMLTPVDYAQERLQDQIIYLRRKTRSLESRLHALQWGVLVLGGAGTFLAAIGRNVWIALTTAIAIAITTKLETDQVENSLIQYNQSLSGLVGVQAWWSALTEWEKSCQANIDLLVDHTEKIIDSEVSGWVQQMQSALEKLRKEQTQRESGEK